jgi:hypothetical protein
VAGMTRVLREGVRTEGFGPVPQKGLYEFTGLSSYREMNSEAITISTTYVRVEGSGPACCSMAATLSSEHCVKGAQD